MEIVKLDERTLAASVRDALRNMFQAVPQGQTLVVKQLVINVNTAWGGGAKVVMGDDNTSEDRSTTTHCSCGKKVHCD